MKYILILILALTSLSSYSSDWIEGSTTTWSGTRDYQLYIPEDSHLGPVPMIVLLHGCMQSAEDFATGTEILSYAKKNRVAVLMPKQEKINNIYQCWNWFFSFNQNRVHGESELITSMTKEIIEEYQIDRRQIYLAGISAGAALANSMGMCFPEIYAGVASHHGVMAFGAHSVFDAYDVMFYGPKKHPEIAAKTGFACQGLKKRQRPLKTITFHGKYGEVMSPLHVPLIVDSVKAYNDYLDDGLRNFSTKRKKEVEEFTPDEGYEYTVVNYGRDIQSVTVNGLGHAWSGGNDELPFNDSLGPKATEMIFSFFELD